MTTIAFKNGVLASDSRVTVGETILPETFMKIRRLHDGSLFGGAGSLEELELVLMAIHDKKEMPKIEDKDTEAMRVHKDGSIFHFSGRLWLPINVSYYAIGSGWKWALAAMETGASAQRAVKYAAERDVYTGGRIHTMRLK